MASSSFYKFNIFVENLGNKLHDFDNDSIKILLTNTAPNVADTVVDTTGGVCVVKSTSNANEIAAASGYVKGGAVITSPVWAQIAGLAKLYGTKVSWVAGASIGPFRYAVIYNDSTGTSATRPVIGYWDYGSPVTLGIGESFTIGNSNDGTDWTVTYPILENQ
jgi:hypothetical protein